MRGLIKARMSIKCCWIWVRKYALNSKNVDFNIFGKFIDVSINIMQQYCSQNPLMAFPSKGNVCDLCKRIVIFKIVSCQVTNERSSLDYQRRTLWEDINWAVCLSGIKEFLWCLGRINYWKMILHLRFPWWLLCICLQRTFHLTPNCI